MWLVNGIIDFVKGVAEFIKTVVNLIEEIINLIRSVLTFLFDAPDFDISEISENLNTPVTALIGKTTSGASLYTTSPIYKVYTALIPIAIIFLLIYFAMYFSNLVLTDSAGWEQLLKPFVYMIGLLLVINNGYEIILKCYEAICDPKTGMMGDLAKLLITPEDQGGIGAKNVLTATGGSWRDFFLGVLGISTEDWASLDSINIKSIVEFLWGILSSLVNLLLLIPYIIFVFIIGLFLKIRLDVVRIRRAIKIGIYMAFSPIAFSNIFSDTLVTTKAFSYFKKIISLFLQGPIILISLSVASLCVEGIPNARFFSKLIVLVAVFRKALKESEEVADSLVGV